MKTKLHALKLAALKICVFKHLRVRNKVPKFYLLKITVFGLYYYKPQLKKKIHSAFLVFLEIRAI